MLTIDLILNGESQFLIFPLQSEGGAVPGIMNDNDDALCSSTTSSIVQFEPNPGCCHQAFLCFGKHSAPARFLATLLSQQRNTTEGLSPSHPHPCSRG